MPKDDLAVGTSGKGLVLVRIGGIELQLTPKQAQEFAASLMQKARIARKDAARTRRGVEPIYKPNGGTWN